MVIQSVLNGAESIETAIKIAGIEKDIHWSYPARQGIERLIQAQQRGKTALVEEKYVFHKSIVYSQKNQSDPKEEPNEKPLEERIADILAKDPRKKKLTELLLSISIPSNNSPTDNSPESITEAIDILSMPWRKENDWRFFVRSYRDENNVEYLTLQEDIPIVVKDAIEGLCHTVERERLHREKTASNLFLLNNRIYDIVVDEVKNAGIDPKEIVSVASLDEKLDKNGSAIIITLRNGDMYKMILSVSLDKMNRV